MSEKSLGKTNIRKKKKSLSGKESQTHLSLTVIGKDREQQREEDPKRIIPYYTLT